MSILDDPTPMPESALLTATAQIMAEGVRSTLPLTATLQSRRQIAQQAEKQKAKRLANGKLPKNCFQGLEIHVFSSKSSKITPCKDCDLQNVPKAFLTSFII